MFNIYINYCVCLVGKRLDVNYVLKAFKNADICTFINTYVAIFLLGFINDFYATVYFFAKWHRNFFYVFFTKSARFFYKNAFLYHLHLRWF